LRLSILWCVIVGLILGASTLMDFAARLCR
ncbi:MAG: hypothetical protein ACI9US_000917, partial [Gammaproteobacteria bacterium]